MHRFVIGLAGLTLAVAGGCLSAPPAQAQTPHRIVSLNLCTDQLLLLLAPDRIAALSGLASDPLLSVMSDTARAYPSIGADAEEILGQAPDLVVAAPFAATATVNLLRRLGKRVLVVEFASDVDGLKRALRQLGQEIGAGDKAEALIGSLDAALPPKSAGGSESDRLKPSALVINFGGLPSGKTSLADTALGLAGYRNAAGDYRTDRKGTIQLESLLAHPPDLLVLGQEAEDYHTVRADNLRHPALLALTRLIPTAHLPQRLTLCATPALADAVHLLADRRDEAQRRAVLRGQP